MTVRDMLGREVLCPERPARIVSLVPSQTELLADLGLDEKVVGITKFCVHPERWFRTKARVGGTKTVHFDRVASLKPDLILANKEENVREQIEALERIAPVWVSDIKSLDDALRMTAEIGMLTGSHEAAMEIATSISAGFRQFPCAPEQAQAVYAIWHGPWMWAGGDTFISDLINRMGWTNTLQDGARYPELTLEEIAAAAPQKVLLSSEPYPFKQKHIDEVKAVLPDADIVLVDGEMFSWYGSRLLKAIPYLRSLILPQE